MKVFVLGLALFSSTAFASSEIKGFEDIFGMLKRGMSCARTKVSAEQRKEIKATVKQAHADAAELEADLKEAQVALDTVMTNPETNELEAMSARKAYKEAMKPLREIRKAARTKINFEILTGEQRVQFYKCKKKGLFQRIRRHGRLQP